MTELETTGLRLLVHTAHALLGAAGRPVGDVPADVGAEIAAVFRDVLGDTNLVPPEISSWVPRYGFGKCLLHAGPAFVVFATVTAPEVAAPIHDHGSWGLVGLYSGVEQEVRYCWQPGVEGACGQLSEIDRVDYLAGDVMAVAPPPDDIHQVFNRGRRHSVAVNLFLCDLVTSGFRVFEPPSYLPSHTGPLAYDRVPSHERRMSVR